MVRGHRRRRPRLPRVEDRRRRAGPAAPPARPGDPGQAAPRRRPEHPPRPHVHLPGRGDRHGREARWRQQRRMASRRLPRCEGRPELRLCDRCRPPGRRVPLGQGGSPGRGTLRACAFGRRRPREPIHRTEPTAAGRSSTRTSWPASRSATRCSPSPRRPDRWRQPGRYRARAHHRGQHLGDGVTLADLVGRVARRPGQEPERRVGRAIGGGAARPPVVIDELVRDDPEQPRAEPARPPAERMQVAERALEGRRGDVLGDLHGSGPAVGEGMDAGQVSAVELREGRRIDPRALHQLPLIGFVTRSSVHPGKCAGVDGADRARSVATASRWSGRGRCRPG